MQARTLLVLSLWLLGCSAPRGAAVGVTNETEGGEQAAEEPRFARIAAALGDEVVSDGAPAGLIAQAEAVEEALGSEPPPLSLPSNPELIAEWLTEVLRWHEERIAAARDREDIARCGGCSEVDAVVYRALVALEHVHLLSGLLEPPVRGHMAETARPLIHETLSHQVARLSPATMGDAIFRLDECQAAAREVRGEVAERVQAWCTERRDHYLARLREQAGTAPGTEPAPPPEDRAPEEPE